MKTPILAIIPINDKWRLEVERLQWILQRHNGTKGRWYGVSFVSSTKDILARCMREKGVPPEDAKRVLDTLPETFRQHLDSISESSQSQ
jgi:hypothetical protein